MPAFIIASDAVSLAEKLYEQLDSSAEFYILLPCSAETVSKHLIPPTHSEDHSKEGQLIRILSELGIPTHKNGYEQLLTAIPLYALDRRQSLSKELYPAVAKAFGYRDWKAIEHSIRSVITAAWKHRDPIVWQRYFPGMHSRPSNKTFLAALADQLR